MINEEIIVCIDKKNSSIFGEEFNNAAMNELCWDEPLFKFGRANKGVCKGVYGDPDFTFNENGELSKAFIIDFIERFCCNHSTAKLHCVYSVLYGDSGEMQAYIWDYNNGSLNLIEKGGMIPRLKEMKCPCCEEVISCAEIDCDYEVVTCPNCGTESAYEDIKVKRNETYDLNALCAKYGIESEKEKEWDYTIINKESNEICISKYCGNGKQVVVPDTVDGMVVKEISNLCLSPMSAKLKREQKKFTEIETITVSNGISFENRIGCGYDNGYFNFSLFANCESLEKICAPSSILYSDYEIFNISLKTNPSLQIVFSDPVEENDNRLQDQLRTLANAKKGDCVRFGQRRSWIVLDCEADRVLLLSDMPVANLPLNERYHKLENWEDCGLYTWLNDFYLNTEFTNTEKSFLVGNDKPVNILSKEDVMKYFDDALIEFEYIETDWLLRPMGEIQELVHTVYSKKDVEMEGENAEMMGNSYIDEYVPSDNIFMIRPIIWVKKSADFN